MNPATFWYTFGTSFGKALWLKIETPFTVEDLHGIAHEQATKMYLSQQEHTEFLYGLIDGYRKGEKR